MNSEGLILFVVTISCWTLSPAHSQVDGDLRFTGFGANSFRGKLEMFYNGEWGSVCSPNSILNVDVFERHAANVACRQMGLGFAISYYTIKHQPDLRFTYGNSTGPIHLEQMECEGTEPHLLRCDHSGLGEATCSHMEDVTLECSDVHVPYNGEVFLSNKSSGLLELYSNDRLGAVCFEDGFGPLHANAVCRQLGYTGASSHRQLPPTEYSGMYWDLGGVALADTSGPCFTHSFDRLPLTSRQNGCSPVYVQCEYTPEDATLYTSGSADLCTLNSTTPLEGDVQLTNSPDPSTEGYIRLFSDGAWSRVCSTNFDYPEADVVCKQLRHPGALGFDSVELSGDPVFELDCSGVETDINECSLTELSSSECSEGASVSCAFYGFPFGEITLRGGVGGAGILFFYNGAFFHPVCSQYFGLEEANVACRQLGYERAVAVRTNSSLPSDYTESDGVNQLYPLPSKCLGDESHLLECEQSLPRQQTCIDGVDLVELQCAHSTPPNLRLVGGPPALSGQPISGRLEVNFGDVWVSIGNSEFDHLSAHVACTQLGFISARQVFNDLRFGEGNGPIILDNVRCMGYEDSIVDCPYSVVVDSSRPSHDVAIECSEELPFPEGALRLTGGPNRTSGRLEIFKYGVWMSVCGETFTDEVASIACTQLGFAGLDSYCTNSCFGDGTDLIYTVDQGCIGGEESLLECGGVVQSQCSRSSLVGLVCVPLAPTTEPPTTTPPPVTMETTQSTESTSTTTTIIPGLDNLYFYIIVGVVGLVVILGVVLILCCVCCCVAKRRRKTRQGGTWRASSVHTNGGTANGIHPHHGNANSSRWPHVDTNTKLTMEKVGDYDDPRASIEMNGFSHSTPSIRTDSDPNLDYKPALSLQLEQVHDHHYENLPGQQDVTISNTLYVEESASPASPPPGYDELEFLPHSKTT